MNIPSNSTPTEFAKYYLQQATREEIETQFELLANKLTELQEKETKQDKYYESAMEQSSFRGDLLSEIMQLCEKEKDFFRYKETKELCKRIYTMYEHSYVEL